MRCYYEILGIERTAALSEVKKAFHKASLIWHPDKNSAPEATVRFQEVQEAYRVLSNVQERAWYDRHRDQILQGGQGGFGGSYTEERLDVFKYFSRSCFDDLDDGPKGFYTVYRKVFEDIANEELLSSGSFSASNIADLKSFPTFGQLDSDYDSVVRPFYTYWERFSTTKSYSWVEKYDTRRLSSRTERRLAEAENRRLRDAAKKERNEEIRALVVYVRRRDKRVAAERARVEAAAKDAHERSLLQATKIRKKNAADLEAEWEREVALGGLSSQWETDFQKELDRLEAGLECTDSASEGTASGAESSNENPTPTVNEGEEDDDFGLFCVACDKTFSSFGAKVNHETSKKHKKRVEVLSSLLLQEEEKLRLSEEFFKAQEYDIYDDNFSERDVKLTKRAKKARRRLLRDVKREEQAEILNGGAERPQLRDDPVELMEYSDSDAETQQFQKENLMKQKKPKRRWKKALDPEVSKRLEEMGEGKAVEGDEIYIVESLSKVKLSEQPQDVSQTHVCMICNEVFPSKNKLFSHIRETSHAVLKSRPSSSSQRPIKNKNRNY